MADKKNEENPGIVYGNVSNGLTSYGDNKLHGTQGHGYAAERANTLYVTARSFLEMIMPKTGQIVW